jgi:hypothetical protein
MARTTLYVWRTETRRFDYFTRGPNCQWCNSELMRGYLPPKSLASQLGFKDVELVESTGLEDHTFTVFYAAGNRLHNATLVTLPMIRILVGGVGGVQETTRS